MRSKFLLVSIAVSMFVVFGGIANAATFMSDSFPYVGSLTTATNAHWDNTGGFSPGQMQVVASKAEVKAPASEDVSKLVGNTISAGDKWYYSAVVTINDTRSDSSADINQDYFMHFKDNGNFNFRARLGVTSASVTDPNTDFRFFIAATSLGSGTVNWGSDLAWGGTYKVVVEWEEQALAGKATLWVDPVDINSTSVMHILPGTQGVAINRLAMRQDSSSAAGGGNYTALVDGVAAGNDFTSVHTNAMNGTNIPEPATMALALLGLIGLGSCRRRS